MQNARPSFISPLARLGGAARPLLDGRAQTIGEAPVLGQGCWVGDYALIGTGCRVGNDTIIDHQVVIEADVTIGHRTLLCYRAQVCAEASIADDCVIGGFIGERSIVGQGARIFGSLVHRHPRTWGGWDDDASMQDGPQIGAGAFVAFGAVIVGAIAVGNCAYIGANSVITCAVAPHVVIPPGSVWQAS
jgi:UDP-3-O-[3-hydroxymyristoyl] glucosamine N-acyltransferase